MTAQIPDTLTHNRQTCALFSNPLEAYFKQNPPRPRFGVRCSALWRGYVAKWVIENDRLYLTGMDQLASEEQTAASFQVQQAHQHAAESPFNFVSVDLADVFGPIELPVFARWYTGELTIPQGELQTYVHMAYASVYEHYLLFEVLEGIVTRTRVLGHEQYAEEKKNRQARNESVQTVDPNGMRRLLRRIWNRQGQGAQ